MTTISPRFSAPQRLLDARQTEAFAIDGNRVERMNQPAERREAEKRVASQIVHPPEASGADERRIEVALVI